MSGSTGDSGIAGLRFGRFGPLLGSLCAPSQHSSCRLHLLTAPYPPPRVNKAILSGLPLVLKGRPGWNRACRLAEGGASGRRSGDDASEKSIDGPAENIGRREVTPE